MKNWRIWVGLGATILIAAAGIYAAYLWWLADPMSSAREGEMVAVQRGRLTVSVKALGAVVVPSKTMLAFGMGGKLKELRVAEGDGVRAGDVLARLDTADLELQVAKAEAALALSRAQLARTQAGPAEADLKAATEALAAAEARYERVKAGPLAAEIASAEAALASAQANYDQLNKGVTGDERAVLQAAVDKAKVAVDQAQAAYDRISWQAGAQGSPQAAALQSATIEYHRALASYNLAVAGPTNDQLQRAQAQIAQARAQLERLRTTGANDEVRSAVAQVARARADLEKLKNSPLPQDVAIAQAQVEQAQANLKQVKRQLDDSALLAPAAGTVVSVGATVGQWVAPGASIVVLADLSKLQIQANVHESYIGQIQKGQPAWVDLEALPGQRIEAHVSEIAPLGTATSGIVSYAVTIDLAPGGLPVKPGMLAQLEIVTAEKPSALSVPKGALGLKNGRWVAKARRDGRLVEVEVKTGARQGRTVEVLEGLAEGDQVLLNVASPIKEER